MCIFSKICLIFTEAQREMAMCFIQRYTRLRKDLISLKTLELELLFGKLDKDSISSMICFRLLCILLLFNNKTKAAHNICINNLIMYHF